MADDAAPMLTALFGMDAWLFPLYSRSTELIATTWCGVPWWVDNEIIPSPFLDLQIVLRNLRGRLGGWCVSGLVQHFLGILLFDRLAAVMLRMERMSARFLAGRLWRIGTRVSGTGESVGRAPKVGGAWVFPGGFSWLVKLVGWQAAGYGSQLRAVLGTPEMVALLVACPQAARELRPVCRALGIETSVLRPGVAVVARPAREVRARVRKARVRGTVEPPWRIPLPRGVLAWARREGFGKIPKD